MSRLVVIGIDGMDSGLIEGLGDSLPNISRLKRSCSPVQMRSVFPPDSPTAWTSIYTGLNPAKHGVITFRDPKTKKGVGEHTGARIGGKTFWDVAGRDNRKVCVLFPHMGYPVWQVNGIMVGRTTEVDIREYDIQSYPQGVLSKLDLTGLRPMTSFPLDLQDMIGPTKELIRREVDLGTRLLDEERWDLFFIYFSSLDNIEHLFWMYYAGTYDSRDNERFKDVIPEFYRFFDEEVIGRFMSVLAEDSSLLVISDHGHGLRPVNVVNMNEVLLEEGLLASDNGANGARSMGVVSRLRRNVANIVNDSRVAGKLASKVLSMFPGSLSLYTSSLPVDLDRSTAFLSDPSGGLKAYSYAGIRVKGSDMSPADYEDLRDRIISLVSGITGPADGSPLAEWVCRREQMYEGPSLSKYPDVVFKLRDDWGVGWEIGSGRFGTNLTHKLHSGNHRQDSAVCLLKLSDGLACQRGTAELMDIAPTVLDILGVARRPEYDGTSLVRREGHER